MMASLLVHASDRREFPVAPLTPPKAGRRLAEVPPVIPAALQAADEPHGAKTRADFPTTNFVPLFPTQPRKDEAVS